MKKAAGSRSCWSGDTSISPRSPSSQDCSHGVGNVGPRPRVLQGQRPSRRSKVRMYGCNRNLLAASREEKPGKGWGRPCTDVRRGITPQKSGRFSVRPSCPQLCKLSTDHRLLFTLDSGEEQLHKALGIDHRGDVCIRSDPFGACCHIAIAFGKRAQFVPAYFP
jgi:hypothetical protein